MLNPAEKGQLSYSEERSFADKNDNQAKERYRKIRIALYTKQIQLQDVARDLDVSTSTMTRTIQGQQWNLKVIRWVKENLNIELPMQQHFRITKIRKQNQKKKQTLDPRFKKYFTPKEVSFYYGIPYKTLAAQRYKKIGIPYRKLGKKVLYEKKDLENYIATQSVKISVYTGNQKGS